MKGLLDRYIAFGRNFFGPSDAVGFRVSRHANLPTCTEALRRVEYVVEGGTGVADVKYVCMYDGSGYAWITESLPGGTYTDEMARDAIGTALVAGNNIDITVNDGANTITIDVETLTIADISGITATASEINKLAGTPAGLTATELGYVDGVTSAIQTQIDGKAPVGATYITQTANATLTGEQALGALATGILKNTTTTGVLSIATSGTDYETAGTSATHAALTGTAVHGLGTMSTQAASAVAITGGSVTGIADITVADGGTGSSTASGARTNLGLVIGTDVQAYDSDLATIAGLTATTNNFLVANASAWASRTPTQAIAHLGLDADIATLSLPASTTISTFGASLTDDADASTARGTLGLGSIATQAASSVSITGGSVTGITDLTLADGGTGASLTDPNADRIMFWDDSAGAVTWLSPGTGLSISGTSLATTITQYTDEMARDALGTALTAGTGITVTPNDGADTITIATTITQYTDELAQDAVGAMVADTATIDVTYTDATPELKWDVKDDSITYAKLQNVSATDKVLGRSTAGAGDVEEITLTAFGRSLIDDAAASNARATLGLVIGTDVPALSHTHAASDVTSGTMATARLGSGTADSTVFLRGDQTWAAGVAGPTGPAGATGTAGTDAGAVMNFLFDTGTSDADPGTGKLRINNATASSATFAYISDADITGASSIAVLNALDDATGTDKGYIYLRESSSKWRLYSIGSVTAGALYRKVSLTHVTGVGSLFTSLANISVSWTRTGDVGATGATGATGPTGPTGATGPQGAAGAGSGDFSSNTATSVDSEIVLFSGTGGKTGKRATDTGIARVTSGVLGTDAPLTDLSGRWTAPGSTTAASLDFSEGTTFGTNKITLIGGANLSADYVLTLPAATDRLVGRDTTDTLTNKTLTTPTISSTGFTNATHAHTGASSGGQLTFAAISKILTGSVSNNPASTANGAVFAVDITVTGAAKGDAAACGHTSTTLTSTSGWRQYAPMVDTDTVRCIWQNNTGVTSDPAAGTAWTIVSDLT